MISGLVEPSARVQGLRCGAEDFLTKPFSPKELLLRIQKILSRASDARSHAVVSAQAEQELLEKQKRMTVVQRKLAERVERVNAIAEMGRTLVGAKNLDELAGQLIVSLQLCLRAGTVLIALREAKDTEFRIVKARGVASRRVQAVSLSAGGDLPSMMLAEGRSLTLEELDGVPGMRREIIPLRAAGLAVGVAVNGLGGSEALIFVGAGRSGSVFKAEQRGDFESLCKFFGSGLASIQKADADKASMVDAVELLVHAVESAKHCRKGHSCRVARFVESMWESLDLPPYELQAIRLAALLHEVDGSEKCACSSREDSVDICLDTAPADLDAAPGLLNSLRHFRERYDGSGGPLGLREEQIPLEARILAVADTFDDCLCNCGSSSPVDEAIRSLRGLSGTSLDPNLVEAFVHHILNGRVRLG
jgi:response regulator RpfG family c-di-GMP phosphodiesterase